MATPNQTSLPSNPTDVRRAPHLDWIHGVMLGGVFAILMFVIMGHGNGVCH
jgi:hypothetical protein